ncbi:MAG TPA: YgiT-type zinc finger protein [Phycisphaerae bacterium]|nr:YgiT-type zinc finger protein [Phycisphaerae bacterium]HNU46989.1 YgiT-type zinc finger protein [Phycisphaerae bacterium]
MTCGSKRVQRTEVSVRLRHGRTVRGVEADVCVACGERYFDLEAMHGLEAGSAENR